MTVKPVKPLTGRKVLFITCSAFGVIIAVNLTLAFQAVATFPGLETKNSYVVSQSFQKDRSAQEALNWDVSAQIERGQLSVTFNTTEGVAEPQIVSAVLGRATHVYEDQSPHFVFDGTRFTAPVSVAPGNWNLRLEAVAEDGTPFRQRIIVRNPG
ncbi:FixH family protein [Litoreibacter roseus]|uniref:RdxH n=1 Tax=Litoreibacter roseus TaxID=2601869 RepID=A0A6N6JES1_9RHOB|nr:FixH family protein [Litoreibacter roseus]GFE64851.1 RdxH [Litoreibacter roseus]